MLLYETDHELLAVDDSDSFNGNVDEFEPLSFATRHEVFSSSAPYPIDPAPLSDTAKRPIDLALQ